MHCQNICQYEGTNFEIIYHDIHILKIQIMNLPWSFHSIRTRTWIIHYSVIAMYVCYLGKKWRKIFFSSIFRFSSAVRQLNVRKISSTSRPVTRNDLGLSASLVYVYTSEVSVTHMQWSWSPLTTRIPVHERGLGDSQWSWPPRTTRIQVHERGLGISLHDYTGCSFRQSQQLETN